jgi:hypothetical protein
VVPLVLGAIGVVVGNTVRSILTVDRRLPLLETAQSLIASPPPREWIGASHSRLNRMVEDSAVVEFAPANPTVKAPYFDCNKSALFFGSDNLEFRQSR